VLEIKIIYLSMFVQLFMAVLTTPITMNLGCTELLPSLDLMIDYVTKAIAPSICAIMTASRRQVNTALQLSFLCKSQRAFSDTFKPGKLGIL
jgi:hypothetical protein